MSKSQSLENVSTAELVKMNKELMKQECEIRMMKTVVNNVLTKRYAHEKMLKTLDNMSVDEKKALAEFVGKSNLSFEQVDAEGKFSKK